MMDLKLLSKLQSSDTVTLILKANSGDVLDYYIISRSVVYDVVCTGQCAGSISGNMISFDIRMSSLVPLIEKGYKFSIRYTSGELKFITEDERVEITPLYVEYNDPGCARIIERYIEFSNALVDKDRIEHQLESLQEELRELNANYNHVSLMHLSGGPSSDPFTEDKTVKRIDESYKPKIAEKEKQIAELQGKSTNISEVDFTPFFAIAGAASRTHGLIDFCGDYAILSLTTSFMLQKGKCPIQSIQGQLLFQLLRDGSGKGFYSFDDNLIYMNGSKEKTVVFIAKYLPNNEIDSSIVTKGLVEEKYSIHLKGVLDLATVVKSKFPHFTLDMGAGRFILSNDQGETIKSKFDVEDAKTVQLNKMLRGVPVQGGITMACIEIPKEVQGMLNLFKEKLVIYVKKRKIIFQNDGLYLVFGR